MTADARLDHASPHVLRDYALLADGQRGALVGPRGDIAWMCAPRWDSDAVFCSLLGGRGGFTVTPVGRFVWGGYYEEGSLIWRSRWTTETGTVECREALAFPGDPRRAVLLRRVIAVDGPARVRVVLQPVAGFGHHRLRGVRQTEAGGWEGRAGDLRIRLSGPSASELLRPDDGEAALAGTIDLLEGAHHDLVLEVSHAPLDQPPPEPDQTWTATETAWREAVPHLGRSLAPRDTRHSYAVLRGLTSAGGGMVAAATMSLPERAAQGRNYDYRYVWIRDQCYAGQAIANDGPHPLLDDAMRFVAERILDDGPDLRPAYTIDGAPVPDERTLDLPGYPGAHRVVAGNHANSQFQLDVFGEALLLFATGARHDHLDTDHRKAIAATVAAIEQRWGDPDAGIWELDQRHWTHSRLTCVAGLRAIAATAAAPHDGAAWTALADTIMASTKDCLHPSGRWQRAPADPRLDASLLLPAIRGALPADDPRTLATLSAIADELTDDLFIYRFRHDARPLGHAEGAFVLCGFLMALARHQQAQAELAGRWFERSRSACGPPGLLAEEYDVAQRQLRGNLPQAFTHALLMESSTRLARPWDEPLP